MQSAGKTTFIEALVGFRIGTTCSGTGTRCPVRYILRDGEPYFAVGNRPCADRSDIQKAVEYHMSALANKVKKAEQFSDEPLEVLVHDKGLPMLDITDLPGLKAKGDGAEEIKKVVAAYVDKPSSRPVVLVKATENVETQADVELLKTVGIDPAKGNATFVVNYFNDQLYKFSRVSELNEYCKGYLKEYGSVYFCMLIYSEEAKLQKDKLDFAGECEYYRSLPVAERKTFDEKLGHLTRDDDVDPRIDEMFGVKSATHKMQSVINDFAVNEGTRYADRLRPLEDQYEQELRDVKQELLKCTPDYIMEQREKYVDEWVETMRNSQACKTRLDDDSVEVCEASDFFEELEQVAKDCDGLTVLGECDCYDKTNGSVDPKHLKTWVEGQLRRQCCRDGTLQPNPSVPDQTVLLERFVAELTADASLQRLDDAFAYVIDRQIAIKEVDLTQVYNISGYAPGGMPGALDELGVIKEVATRPLHQVKNLLKPMLHQVSIIYQRSVGAASEKLKQHTGYTEKLQKKLTASYVQHLEGKVQEAEVDFRNAVTVKASYLQADRSVCEAASSRPTRQGQNLWANVLTLLPPRSVCSAIAAAMWGPQVLKSLVGQVPRLGFLNTESKMMMMTAGVAISAYKTVNLIEGPRDTPRMVVNDNNQVRRLNDSAARYCERIKSELIDDFRSRSARTLFDYLKNRIMNDVRAEMKKQTRDLDATEIHEETHARAELLNKKGRELKQSLTCIQRVLSHFQELSHADFVVCEGE
eukprot:TRINITY_DN33684_c0_g1_i1.p1 TRINITY_DN33684_c0_g1~~TRINITY_DN33684_c0_g1_i1.p1  ORF type:complete len:819 (+),score=135.21 TRINITY_DN33684_c0_g1_i1:195-2459(+)